ncbi:hypothetical protein GCM10027570_48490 [Streptomonospora sediminis]
MILDETWRTSSYSNTKGGECVEIAATSEHGTAVRDTQNRDAGHLVMSSDAWTAFLTAVKSAEL